MSEGLPRSSLLGSLLLEARLRSKLSQRELAIRAGISKSTIAAYELGSKRPRLETLMRLVRAAGFDLRLHLEPHEDHDESRSARTETTPRKDHQAYRRRQLELIGRARKSLDVYVDLLKAYPEVPELSE